MNDGSELKRVKGEKRVERPLETVGLSLNSDREMEIVKKTVSEFGRGRCGGEWRAAMGVICSIATVPKSLFFTIELRTCVF